MSINLEQAKSIRRDVVQVFSNDTIAELLTVPQPLQLSTPGTSDFLPKLTFYAAHERGPAFDSDKMKDKESSPASERQASERRTIEQLAKDTASKFDAVAFPANRFKVLEQSLKEAYESHGGDDSMFGHFEWTLAAEMGKAGITVRTARLGISFRSEGQELAVEFQLKSKVDPNSRKVQDVTVTAKAYDWVTKADAELGANGFEDLVGNMVFNKGIDRKERELKGTLCDARELSEQLLVQDRLMTEKFKDSRRSGIDIAMREKGDARVNSNLTASFAHAYKKGGLKAVENLAADINHCETSHADVVISSILTQRIIARMPLVISIVDKETPGEVRIHRGFEVSQEAARLASVMSAEQLNKLGIVKHQCASGYVQLHGAVIAVGSLNKKRE